MVEELRKLKRQGLMEAIVDTLQDSIGSIDFWTNTDKQKKARSNIKTALMLTGIVELKKNRERKSWLKKYGAGLDL